MRSSLRKIIKNSFVKNLWAIINQENIFFSKKILLFLSAGSILLIIGQTAQVYAPILLGNIVNIVTSNNQDIILPIVLTVAYGTIFWFGRASGETVDALWIYITNNLEYKLSVNFINKIVTHNFIKIPTGEVIQIWSRGTKAIAELINSIFFSIFPQITMLLFILVTLSIKFSPLVSLLAFLGGAVYFVWLKYISTKVSIAVELLNTSENETMGIAYDFIKNKRVFILYKSFKALLQNFNFAKNKEIHQDFKLVMLQSIWMIGNALIISSFVTISILVFLTLRNNIQDNPGGIVSLTYLIVMLFQPIENLSGFAHNVIELTAKARPLIDLNHQFNDTQTLCDSDKKWDTIKFNKFSINNKQGPMFQPFDLNINQYDKILITGESGVGKTSLIEQLLFNLQSVEKTITISHHGAPKDANIFSNIATYIPQEDIILNIGLLDNITGGNKDLYPQAIEIMSRLNISKELMEKIRNNEPAFEAGSQLSGGEKRRISIARGIIFAKDILLFDEPTTGLDSLNQEKIIKYITSLQNKTVIVISHATSINQFFNKELELKRLINQ